MEFAGKTGKKRQRKSKVRTTEVSSSSDISSSSDSEADTKELKKKSKTSKSKSKSKSKTSKHVDEPPAQAEKEEETIPEANPAGVAEDVAATPAAPTSKFTQTYLRLLTSQFSNDLDALRRAADFKESSSVSILVNALRQGESLFSEAEKEIVLSGGRVSGVE